MWLGYASGAPSCPGQSWGAPELPVSRPRGLHGCVLVFPMRTELRG